MNEDQPRGRREPGCARIGPREAQHTRISVLADKTLADLAWRVRSLGQKLPLRFPDRGPRPRFPFRSCFELKRVAVSELASRCDMRGHGRVVAWGPGSMGRRQAGSNILPGS